LLAAAQFVATGEAVYVGDELSTALMGPLTDAGPDKAFAALMLRLPDVGELMQLRGDCDPEALHDARQIVKEALAQQLETPLNDAFASYDPAQVFSPDAAAAGRRALAAATLDLLTAPRGNREALRGENFFFASRNMTDMMAALDSLSQVGGDRFEASLSAFKERFSSNALVMDKWFRVQAMASSGDGIATFERLRSDPAFNLLNPNRVRALGSAFAMGNHKSFHRADGAGYQVLCNLIADVDDVNGAVAARLCTLLESTTRVESNRRALASQAMDGLLSRNQLSPNAREILSKIASAL
jgi:aminopeptidase N